jgi:putative chitobiose transport system substrate-binding protein
VQAIADYQAKMQSGEKSALAQGKLISAGQLSKAEVLIPPMKDVGVLKKAIYENLQAAMLGEKTVEQAIELAAKAWDGRAK